MTEKEEEIAKLLDKIEQLEEEVMRYEEVVDGKSSKKKTKKAKQSKLEIELEAKDREIRELKNRMGFLRKEKLELQKEFDDLKQKNEPSNVISVEELRKKDEPPLNALLQELQDKIKKQESIIKKYRYQKVDPDEFDAQLKEKDGKIDQLQKELELLNSKTEERSIKEETGDNSVSSGIKAEILSDLQNQLNKAKFRNEELRKQLDMYEKKDKGGFSAEIKELKEKIAELNNQLEQKDAQIELLEEKSIMLKSVTGEKSTDGIIEELQNKLNKARAQIITLQEQLQAATSSNLLLQDNSSSEINSQLKIQREMASFLQKQLNDSNQALKTKEEEIATIKNEAIRIKRKYEDLENLIKQKDGTIGKIQTELDSFKIKAQIQSTSKQPITPDLDLRIRELESLVEDLTKQNIQQRIEISELRKN